MRSRGAEEEGEREYQTGSVLSVQSWMWGLISQSPVLRQFKSRLGHWNQQKPIECHLI